ncbi:hypothetical protein [Deinococcus multiflagellatus]|uniref:Uncharacterized protein n=1 Tax=Deinococcus multiflagellatus TaxID=1656887 RepID=A0ABW1ZRA5_9DEIO
MIPSTIDAAFSPVKVNGGYDILDVPENQEVAIIDKLIAAYYD